MKFKIFFFVILSIPIILGKPFYDFTRNTTESESEPKLGLRTIFDAPTIQKECLSNERRDSNGDCQIFNTPTKQIKKKCKGHGKYRRCFSVTPTKQRKQCAYGRKPDIDGNCRHFFIINWYVFLIKLNKPEGNCVFFFLLSYHLPKVG